MVPVVTYFVRSFGTPEDPEVVKFWQKIAHYTDGGSVPSYLSGRITAFCFWDVDGASLYKFEQQSRKKTRRLVLSGVPYHRIDSDDVPPGYVSVPVKVDDHEHVYEAIMVAGSVGMKVTSSGEPGVAPTRRDWQAPEAADNGSESAAVPPVGIDTVQSVTGWFMVKVRTAEEHDGALMGHDDDLVVLDGLRSAPYNEPTGTGH